MQDLVQLMSQLASLQLFHGVKQRRPPQPWRMAKLVMNLDRFEYSMIYVPATRRCIRHHSAFHNIFQFFSRRHHDLRPTVGEYLCSRPHFGLPVWLVPQSLWRNRPIATFYISLEICTLFFLSLYLVQGMILLLKSCNDEKWWAFTWNFPAPRFCACEPFYVFAWDRRNIGSVTLIPCKRHSECGKSK